MTPVACLVAKRVACQGRSENLIVESLPPGLSGWVTPRAEIVNFDDDRTAQICRQQTSEPALAGPTRTINGDDMRSAGHWSGSDPPSDLLDLDDTHVTMVGKGSLVL